MGTVCLYHSITTTSDRFRQKKDEEVVDCGKRIENVVRIRICHDTCVLVRYEYDAPAIKVFVFVGGNL